MPRHKRCRRVCGLPMHTCFAPVASGAGPTHSIIMGVDEYESLRLIDHEGLTQEECAAQMDISRTTVQQIYNDARKKLVCLLVEGIPLTIEGGAYCLSNEGSQGHGHGRFGYGN